MNHPLGAKNGKDGKKGIFQNSANVNSTANLNANTANYHSQNVGAKPASKHYLSGSMQELPGQSQTNLNSNNVYQRSHH